MRIEEKNDVFVIVDFNELEAYRIACKIENDGLEFYKNLLQIVDEAATREALVLLIEEEKKHLSVFEKCLSGLRQKKEDTSEDNDLLSSLDYGIFSVFQGALGLKEAVKGKENALRLGIAIENNSIRFYAAIKDKVSSRETKDEISSIIKEELKHKQVLENALSAGNPHHRGNF